MSQDAGPLAGARPPGRAPRRRLWVAAAVAVLLAVVVAVVVLTHDSARKSPSAAGTLVSLQAKPAALPRVLDATSGSLHDYWSTEFQKVYGKPFHDLAGGVQPKTPNSPRWTCQGHKLGYEDIKGNAFYCPTDDYIAYDAAFLLPLLDKKFGALTPAVVLAHEMGHAIQARAGVHAPSVIVELQADCFAGAWVAYAQSSGTDPVEVAPSALDSSIRAIPALRDQPGTPATNPQAHGLGFDRVNAFQTGYQNGAARCARFPNGDVVVTELPFQTPADASTGGNMSLTEALPFFTADLDAFWSENLGRLSTGATYHPPRQTLRRSPPLPDCPGDPGYDPRAATAYCAPSGTVAAATTPLVKLYSAIGDMAPGAALSQSWARGAQDEAGLPTSGESADLQRVCFTGAWVSAIGADAASPVQLSPGDIDEVLLSVLTPLSPSGVHQVESASFERTDALRRGLLQGLAGCRR
jgi:predicted metalloprotease